MSQNDNQARNKLVTEHLHLVGYVVNEVLNRVPAHVAREDLISAGNLCIVKASRTFDPSRGVPFAHYALIRLRGAMGDELRALDFISRGARQRARAYLRVQEDLTATLKRAPTREEMAEAMDLNVRDIDKARGDNQIRMVDIDDRPEDNAAAYVEDGEPGPLDSVLAGERGRYLKAAMETLPEALRQVIHGLYIEERSIAELAEERGVTQSRISQQRTEALNLMRDGINAHLDPDMVRTGDRPDGVAERRRQAYYAAVAGRAAMAAEVGMLASLNAARAEGQSTSVRERHLRVVEPMAA